MLTVIGSLKGGSGKSTVAFNLGVWLSHKRQSVTLLDLDPQGTLTDVVEVREDEQYEPAITSTAPSTRQLGRLLESRPANTHLLADVSIGNPNVMRRAINACDQILLPVPPSQADIWSVQRFLGYLDKWQADSDSRPQVITFINRADTHIGVRETAEAMEALRSLPGIRVLTSSLGQRTVFRRSFSEGLGVFELEPSSKASREFDALANKIFPRKTRY